MSNDGKQQPQTPGQSMGPIKVKELHFLALEGVRLGGLRACEGEGTIHHLFSGKHRKGWTTEIVREPWHRMYRVTETEKDPDGKWPGTRVCLIPESAASYVPAEVA